ncbi:GNAT family N-acetyltransferase [Parenemella sanctibonifatiensis]|uniref:GNAT family N-acetyltransferase n=1 Tax=Parenemella sanctibonifatiensis TaxID=2016505 RepID=A0A255E2R9_9ACTN|nr:GNAT family N-acetyltransferase [Parenemella sanctibonifatiensis]
MSSPAAACNVRLIPSGPAGRLTERWKENLVSELRDARAEDALGIAQVLTRGWQDAYTGLMPQAYLDNLDPRERLPHWEGVLSTLDEREFVLVTELGGDVVGVCHVRPSRDEDATADTAEIVAIYVNSGLWGTGEGHALHTEAIARMRKMGYTEVTLWVLDGNRLASKFYDRHQWAEDEDTRAFEREGFELVEKRRRLAL